MLKKIIYTLFFIAVFLGNAQAQSVEAKWITAAETLPDTNVWLGYRKVVDMKKTFGPVKAKIAVDSKYWLWINNKLVVFEGGLKRGPNPNDTYYDEVDLSPWLKKGKNTIAVQVWYFGKQGFSHKSSGKPALFFDCDNAGVPLKSDSTWLCKWLKEYSTAGAPYANYRLSEPSLLYDARIADDTWKTTAPLKPAVEVAAAGEGPWNKLVLRPIPLFKNFGIKQYQSTQHIKAAKTDTLAGLLPYNAQVTPYLKIDAAEAGKKIIICTDNYLHYDGGATYLRAEYITKKGVQEYESYGWLNGHKVYYILPEGVKVLATGYRETGYDTEFAGSFTCSDAFFNTLWKKSRRTLYLTMRDSYMDCPDRERAQWTGDAVNESGEAFYALAPSSHALTKKWLTEIFNWQRADSVLYAPVPSGKWNVELPDQSLATVGYYGLWNYYLHTGDKEMLALGYEKIKNYLALWKPDGKGMVQFRRGGWAWGDWGDQKDMVLIFHSFYYMALKGLQQSAVVLNKNDDARRFADEMRLFKAAFNREYWNGKAYRHTDYKGLTDDRVQALAIVAGLADSDKYPALLQVFKTEEHASPYMEKYVMEALFQMNEGAYALQRHKKRFDRMVNHPYFTTLWEGWNFNDPTYGGGTINHAWSGGGLTILSQYLCGIAPIEAAYRVFKIAPNPSGIDTASATVSSVAGLIKSAYKVSAGKFLLEASVPQNTHAVIGIPAGYNQIKLNGKVIWQNGTYTDTQMQHNVINSQHISFTLPAGKYQFEAIK